MKYLLTSIFAITFLLSNAQTKKDDVFSKMKVNFAVPDLPAFKAMGVESSNILRPTTVEAVSAILPQFYNGGNLSLPKNIAIELSPVLLYHANKKIPIDLDTYIKHSVWNSFRISFGTSADSSKNSPNASKLGLGFRFSLINKGDLKTDRKRLLNEGMILEKKTIIESELEDEFMEELQKKINAKRKEAGEEPLSLMQISQDTTLYNENDLKVYIQKRIDEIEELHTNKILDNHMKFLKKLEAVREDYKKSSWNAEKLDVAFAFVNRSENGLSQNLKYNKFSAWITYANGVEDWGQFLVGLNLSNNPFFVKNTNKEQNFWLSSLSSRFYAGSNQAKGFIEGQYLRNQFEKSNNWSLYIGGEISLFNGIWAHLYGGVQKGQSLTQIVSSFDLRFTLPEK